MPEPLRYDSGIHYDTPGLTWDGFLPEPNTTMPNDNRVSAALAPEAKASFLTKIADASALIPFGINLTPTERRRIPSIAEERAGMLDAFTVAMTAHPELMPNFLNMTEINKDLTLMRDLMPLSASVHELAEKVDDTMKVASADLLVAFSCFYASVKEARRRNVPGTDAIYGQLAPYFARGGGSSTPPTPPTP